MVDFPFADLPGGDLVEQGFVDLEAGVVSIPSLLVKIGSPKLKDLGFDVKVPQIRSDADLPEHQLYELLALSGSDTAHGRYNSLLRRLVSFTRAVSTCAFRPTLKQ